MRNALSSALEIAGAALVTGGVASLTSAPVGVVLGGAFLLVFGVRMGNA